MSQSLSIRLPTILILLAAAISKSFMQQITCNSGYGQPPSTCNGVCVTQTNKTPGITTISYYCSPNVCPSNISIDTYTCCNTNNYCNTVSTAGTLICNHSSDSGITTLSGCAACGTGTSTNIGTIYACATQCTPGIYTYEGISYTVKCCYSNKCNTAQTVFNLFGSLQLQLTSFLVLIFILTV